MDHALLDFHFVDPGAVEGHAPPLLFYAAAYLALAQATGSALVTYDPALAGAAKHVEIEVVVPGA